MSTPASELDYTKARKRSSRPKKIVLALALIVLVIFVTYGYLAKPSPPQQSITLAIVGFTNSAWPVFIAHDMGIFGKYGLNVTIISLGSGRDLITALGAGQVDVGWTGPDVLIGAKLEGFDGVEIGASETTRPFYLVTRPNITTVQQLKGTVGGVTTYGSGLVFLTTVAMLDKLGLDPAKDVTLISMPLSTSVRFAALQAGKIDFTLTFDAPTARKLGLNVLLYLPDMIDNLWGSGYTVTTKYLDTHRPLLKTFIMALGESTKFFFDNKEKSKTVLGKWLQVTDLDSLESDYQDMVPVMLKIPEISLDQMKGVLQLMAPYTPGAANADPSIFIDSSIVRELETEGFYRVLWSGT
jgi:NitT/TauT family transport system substrate-binding protein